MLTEELKEQTHKEFEERIEKFKYDFLNHQGIHSKEYMIDFYLKILKEGFIDSLIDKTVQMIEERIVEIIDKMEGFEIDGKVFVNQISKIELKSLITNKSDINKLTE